jgi:hypothetical protein
VLRIFRRRVPSLFFVVIPAIAFDSLFFSFRGTSTTMNNLNNTPNNNKQQAIHNKPKIPYVKHLVEEDKHHQVSIFCVYHFQSRIALTILFYLMYTTTQLCVTISDTVGASGCLSEDDSILSSSGSPSSSPSSPSTTHDKPTPLAPPPRLPRVSIGIPIWTANTNKKNTTVMIPYRQCRPPRGRPRHRFFSFRDCLFLVPLFLLPRLSFLSPEGILDRTVFRPRTVLGFWT